MRLSHMRRTPLSGASSGNEAHAFKVVRKFSLVFWTQAAHVFKKPKKIRPKISRKNPKRNKLN